MTVLLMSALLTAPAPVAAQSSQYDVTYTTTGTANSQYTGLPPNSTPYTTNGGSTHGSAGTSVGVMGGSGSFTAGCTGPITATLKWNTGINNDPAPAAVIVQEHSVASFTTTSQPGSTVTGSCDNGLKVTSPAGVTSYTADSSTYTVKSGSSFSLPARSPVANASGSTGNSTPTPVCSGNTSITYTVTATPVTITPTGTTASANGPMALTGQQLGGTLNIPSGFTAKSYAWSVGGDTFATYDKDAPNGTHTTQLVPLSSADKAATKFQFYDKKAENIIISCAATVTAPDGSLLTVTAQSQQITVLKPTVTKWDIITGYVQPHGAGVWGLEPDPSTTNTDGETWKNITISLPTQFSGGQGCIAQLLTPDREEYIGATPTPLVPNNGIKGLDGGFPYGPIWSLPVPGADSDSPSTQISGGNPGGTISKITAHDLFTTYVMYMPPGTNSVWVPLQSYDWSWAGTVSWVNNAWTLTAGTPANAAAEPLYTASNTDTPPTWTVVH